MSLFAGDYPGFLTFQALNQDRFPLKILPEKKEKAEWQPRVQEKIAPEILDRDVKYLRQ